MREQPQWRALPVAVVEADRPQAKLLWVNEHARALRVLPGMRLAAARSLAPQLRASVVPEAQISAAIDALFSLLSGFSPRVEPQQNEPGTLWVDPSGMCLLWGDLEQWAESVSAALSQQGLLAAVVVGFHRFRCQAIARSRPALEPSVYVLADPRREARLAAGVPLDRLGFSPTLRDELAGLGVHTLGEFMALPRAELRARFGVEAQRLHARGGDDDWAPMQPRAFVDPIRDHVQLDPPEEKLERLLFRIKPALEGLLRRLADRGAAMSRLRLTLELDHADGQAHLLEPAAPTLDAMQLLELLRLRLEAIGAGLPAGVETFTLELEGQRSDPRQIALFRAQQKRDLEAGERALARLRALFGPESVSVAALAPAHLPEARFCWTPLTRLAYPDPQRMQVDGELPPRVRRLLPRPRRLAATDEALRPGERLDPSLGVIARMQGPFRASGGWWVRQVEREYYYAEIDGREGEAEILWVFYDRPRRRWYLHGWLA
nr:hypothetical protein [Pseudenhygromyxa sp. WMMC2535]